MYGIVHCGIGVILNCSSNTEGKKVLCMRVCQPLTDDSHGVKSKGMFV